MTSEAPKQHHFCPVHIYNKFVWLASFLQPVVLLAMRLLVGAGFYYTGSGKLQHLDQTAKFFTHLGIPAPRLNAIMAGSTECYGGILLFFGLASRLVSIPLAFTMIIAYSTADRETLKYIIDDPGKFLGSDPYPFFITCLVVLAFGPGPLSIDGLIKWFMNRKAVHKGLLPELK